MHNSEHYFGTTLKVLINFFCTLTLEDVKYSSHEQCIAFKVSRRHKLTTMQSCGWKIIAINSAESVIQRTS